MLALSLGSEVDLTSYVPILPCEGEVETLASEKGATDIAGLIYLIRASTKPLP